MQFVSCLDHIKAECIPREIVSHEYDHQYECRHYAFALAFCPREIFQADSSFCGYFVLLDKVQYVKLCIFALISDFAIGGIFSITALAYMYPVAVAFCLWWNLKLTRALEEIL